MRLDTCLTCVWGCRKWILCREASCTYFFRAFCSVPSKDEILKCLTRGRMWLFTAWSRVQPLGVEVPSSYSAGRKRRKGVLEAPQRVFFLHERSRYTILYKDKQHPTKNLTQAPNYRHHCQHKMGNNYSGNDCLTCCCTHRLQCDMCASFELSCKKGCGDVESSLSVQWGPVDFLQRSNLNKTDDEN